MLLHSIISKPIEYTLQIYYNLSKYLILDYLAIFLSIYLELFVSERFSDYAYEELKPTSTEEYDLSLLELEELKQLKE